MAMSGSRSAGSEMTLPLPKALEGHPQHGCEGRNPAPPPPKVTVGHLGVGSPDLPLVLKSPHLMEDKLEALRHVQGHGSL